MKNRDKTMAIRSTVFGSPKAGVMHHNIDFDSGEAHRRACPTRAREGRSTLLGVLSQASRSSRSDPQTGARGDQQPWCRPTCSGCSIAGYLRTFQEIIISTLLHPFVQGRKPTPKSIEICFRGSPLVNARRTASRLNSSPYRCPMIALLDC